MAVMFPRTLRQADVKSDAELAVFDEIENQLFDEWLAFQSVHRRAARRGRSAIEDGRRAEVYAAIEKIRQERESAEDDIDAVQDSRAFLDCALPQLSKQRRAVLELDRQGLRVEQIQARFGVSA